MSKANDKLSGVERRRKVSEADSLFTKAEHAEASLAAKKFEKAALLYRQAGLGLAARAAYQDASEAFTKAGRLQDAEKCNGLAEAVPVYYEEDIV